VTFAQLHDGFYRNPKVRAVEPAAAWMWVASIGYANERLSDGFIPKAALHDLATLDAKPRAKLVEQLVAERLWEPCEGGWMIHDFLMWNPSKEAVIARRAANLARVNKHRDNAATHGDGNARVMRYNERTQRVSNPPPNASVPNASEKTSPIPSPAPSAATPLPSQPTSPASATTPPALPIDLGDPTPPKAKPAPRKASTPKPAKPPPPFNIGAAFEALATASDGRFAPGIDRDWTDGIRIAVAKRIRQYPDLAEWRLVGSWLLAGGDGYRESLGPSWAASNGLPDAMARAREWKAKGGDVIAARFTPAAPPDPADAVWAAAARKVGVAL
jgi:hypothetical protein